jgi:hypothetical protein
MVRTHILLKDETIGNIIPRRTISSNKELLEAVKEFGVSGKWEYQQLKEKIKFEELTNDPEEIKKMKKRSSYYLGFKLGVPAKRIEQSKAILKYGTPDVLNLIATGKISLEAGYQWSIKIRDTEKLASGKKRGSLIFKLFSFLKRESERKTDSKNIDLLILRNDIRHQYYQMLREFYENNLISEEEYNALQGRHE